MEELKQALIELVSILSVPAIASVWLWAANELYYRAFGRYKYRAILTTGIIGTPVHETAHAVTAILFGMKVTEIAFFKPDPVSQTLGYVTYQYNPSYFIHRLGMLFTGLAPLFAGAYLVYWFFSVTHLPNLHGFFVLSDQRMLAEIGTLRALGQWAFTMVECITSWDAVLAILGAMMVGLHATPSVADLKGCLRGALAVLVVLLTYWGVLKLLPSPPELLIVKSVQWLNHLGTAILQMALLSVLGAVALSAVGFATNRIILKKKRLNAARFRLESGEKSGEPL
ncbi:hypothetical protein [Marinobacterium aestuariivivens]|uniref:Peptidase M50 domain-containing protein n=1 Tax=Marinobacterium aestuariivivens TaxID=1698799 RepID=A0ABW2A9M5_9GAMM